MVDDCWLKLIEGPLDPAGWPKIDDWLEDVAVGCPKVDTGIDGWPKAGAEGRPNVDGADGCPKIGVAPEVCPKLDCEDGFPKTGPASDGWLNAGADPWIELEF